MKLSPKSRSPVRVGDLSKIGYPLGLDPYLFYLAAGMHEPPKPAEVRSMQYARQI
jgi:hypothetical protein